MLPRTSLRLAMAMTATARLLVSMQKEEELATKHGAGLIAYDLLAEREYTLDRGRPTDLPHYPPADLTSSPVHEGLGSSPSDPYQRTLPNQPMRPVETTTLEVAEEETSIVATTDLARRWAPLSFWLHRSTTSSEGEGEGTNLQRYVESRMTSPAPPLPADAAEQLEAFAASLVKGERAAVEWDRAVAQFDAAPQLGGMLLCEPQAYGAHLEELRAKAVAAAGEKGCAELDKALELLRRRAISRRNTAVEELRSGPLLSSFSTSSTDVWRRLIEAVERRLKPSAAAADVLVAKAWGASSGDSKMRRLWTMWECVMGDEGRTPPEVRPAVALLLLAAVASIPATSATKLDGDGEGAEEGGGLMKAIVEAPLLEKRAWVAAQLEDLLLRGTTSSSSKKKLLAVANALKAAGRHDAYKLLRIAEAAEAVEQRTKTAEVSALLVPLLAEEDNARQMVARLLQQQEAKGTVLKLLKPLKLQSHDEESENAAPNGKGSGEGEELLSIDEVMARAEWSSRGRAVSMQLMSDTATLHVMHRIVNTELAVKKKHPSAPSSRGGLQQLPPLFSEEVAGAMYGVLRAREQRAEAAVARFKKVLRVLLTEGAGRSLDEVVAVLAAHGGGSEATLLRQPRSATPPSETVVAPAANVVAEVLRAVAAAHPQWVEAGVLPSIHDGLDNDQLLLTAMRVFLRLSYVPQAAMAMIKSRFRRRIGPVGLGSHQHNVPVEIGMAEVYDNVQYKTYDWQGWYQRMMDIYHRNASIRCRLQELRGLDAAGRGAFLDTQAERRLRILAGDKVGQGMIKLDSDKFEDHSDNKEYGTVKLQQLLSEARKTRLGREYWPTVEVKVRRPSGQTKMRYSTLDWGRVEERSKELYDKYKELKKTRLFVPPTATWLKIKGTGAAGGSGGAAGGQDEMGYTVDSLFELDNPTSGCCSPPSDCTLVEAFKCHCAALKVRHVNSTFLALLAANDSKSPLAGGAAAGDSEHIARKEEAITALDFSSNYLGNRQVLAVCRLAATHMPFLASISFKHARLFATDKRPTSVSGNDCLQRMCAALSGHPSLAELDLSDNEVATQGYLWLVELARRTPSLKVIRTDNTLLESHERAHLTLVLQRKRRYNPPGALLPLKVPLHLSNMSMARPADDLHSEAAWSGPAKHTIDWNNWAFQDVEEGFTHYRKSPQVYEYLHGLLTGSWMYKSFEAETFPAPVFKSIEELYPTMPKSLLVGQTVEEMEACERREKQLEQLRAVTKEMLQCLHLSVFPHDAVVLEAGDVGQWVHIVGRGGAVRLRKGEEVATVEEGMIFGEEEFLPDCQQQVRQLHAVAKVVEGEREGGRGGVEVWQLRKEVFRRYMAKAVSTHRSNWRKFVETLPCMLGVGPLCRNAVCDACRNEHTFQKEGTTIVPEEELHSTIALVTEGRASVRRIDAEGGDVEVSYLTRGDVFAIHPDTSTKGLRLLVGSSDWCKCVLLTAGLMARTFPLELRQHLLKTGSNYDAPLPQPKGFRPMGK